MSRPFPVENYYVNFLRLRIPGEDLVVCPVSCQESFSGIGGPLVDFSSSSTSTPPIRVFISLYFLSLPLKRTAFCLTVRPLAPLYFE